MKIKTTNLSQDVIRFLTVNLSVTEINFYMPIEILKQRPVKMETRLLFAVLILLNSRVMPRKHEIYVRLLKHVMYLSQPF